MSPPPMIEDPCKQCGKRFQQPRVRGRPWNFCSLACKHEARRVRCRVQKKLRYNEMREAGVPPTVAQSASTARIRFEVVMQLAKEGAYR